MRAGKWMLVGGLVSGLTACASSTDMSQVPGYGKEHAINAPLSAAILRRVKEITPDDAEPVIQRTAVAESTVARPTAGAQPAQSAPAVKAPAGSSQQPQAATAAASAAAVVVAPPQVAASAPEVPKQRWRVEVTDGSLSRALKRWAAKEGTTIVWEAPKDKPAVYAEYVGTFDEAIYKVMADTWRTEYRLRACGYDNMVLVRLESQPCKR